jgi:uncharacterized membrane protein YgdD (TMEM256/DUF423 family)
MFMSGVAGLTAVGFGAFGAHALKATLAAHGTRDLWETAVIYHLVHAVALFGAALWMERSPTRAALWAARCWAVGILYFSGSLYGLALGGPAQLLGPITPLGGLFLLAGWSCVIVGSFTAASPSGKS